MVFLFQHVEGLSNITVIEYVAHVKKHLHES